ncbi:alpha/beta hydrolase [Polymorphum gilvum]|uniref:Hydrolase, alpha/beta fold family protein n=1 Tax=Polymorphum gilvum (strain LMG 25793 / CGMCC 1.9160 / SL003B-26A1) TaxID=991905 RepID=F2J096_POLGS|nr:alpha/beta hydrolase [Polymorphum gilvum]ADZ68631.1 Hydrolase, alpha/beta fold family protein [Polymorphum gilvum SL003B-26A1]
MGVDEPQFITVGTGAQARPIAVRHRAGAAPGVLWLSGFRSDMTGTKAEALAEWAATSGLAATRMDYSGHGASGGAFADGTVSRWLEEAKAVFDRFCQGPTIIVGSSMGGWIALLLTLAHVAEVGEAASRIRGLVLIAPATDFTEELMWKQRFTEEIRQAILAQGRWEQPSAYGDEPYVITRALIEDGRHHLLMDRPHRLGCPVTILQGRADPDVPWSHARRLVEALPDDDVTFTLVPDGDHRLSRSQDIALLLKAVERAARRPDSAA